MELATIKFGIKAGYSKTGNHVVMDYNSLSSEVYNILDIAGYVRNGVNMAFIMPAGSDTSANTGTIVKKALIAKAQAKAGKMFAVYGHLTDAQSVIDDITSATSVSDLNEYANAIERAF